MARTQVMDSASSQFFIVQQDSPHLDGKYAAFGRVTEGMEGVDDIASVKTGTVASAGMEDVPVKAIVIETITIDSGSGSKKSSKSSKSTAKPSKNDDEEEDEETPKPTAKSTAKPLQDGEEDDETDDELSQIAPPAELF